MKRKIQAYITCACLTVVLTLLTSLTATAQEAGYFNHQYLQPVLINPGATGGEVSTMNELLALSFPG